MPKITLPPKASGLPEVVVEDARVLVLVGANGSGKSRMGEWVERRAGPKAHRLTAQRALALPSHVQPRAYEQAESVLLYGHYNAGQTTDQRAANKFSHRWGNEPSTHMLSDFEHVLALLFADESRRNREYSRAALNQVPSTKPPQCRLDVLSEIWREVMPQRLLTIFDDKIDAQASTGSKYEARHMSDGERVTVYLIGQALCVPPGSVVIIDEPEIHLHRAIQALLWDRVEQSRPDCAFVYITHDLDFAVTRTGARRIWLKEYDGLHWVWEDVPPGPGMPDALLFQVLGSRRPLLFVEGDETSYDVTIYAALYPEELIVPRQSCAKVVESTKSMGALSSLHNLSVRGVVDRDRRGDDEIAALRAAGVLVADVAEVENLLCIAEALEAVATQLRAPDVEKATVAAKGAVMTEMTKVVDQQALGRGLAEVQFRLNGFGPRIGKSDAAKLGADLHAHVGAIDVLETVARCRALFDSAVAGADYQAALRLFNCKGMIAFVASSFGITKDVYVQMVIGFIKAEPQGVLAVAMRRKIEASA